MSKSCNKIRIGNKELVTSPKEMKLKDAKIYCSQQNRKLSDYSEKLFKLYSNYVFTKKCKMHKNLMFAIPNSTKCFYAGYFDIFESTVSLRKSCYQNEHFFLCEQFKTNQLPNKPTNLNSEHKTDNSWTIVKILSGVIILMVACVSDCSKLSYSLS